MKEEEILTGNGDIINFTLIALVKLNQIWMGWNRTCCEKCLVWTSEDRSIHIKYMKSNEDINIRYLKKVKQ